jgi:hypothetical protein
MCLTFDKKLPDVAGDEAAAEARRALTRQMWRERLCGVQRNHEVWQVLHPSLSMFRTHTIFNLQMPDLQQSHRQCVIVALTRSLCTLVMAVSGHLKPHLVFLKGCCACAQSLLSVRSLVLPMHEDTHTWLKFASLCRKSGRPK